MDGKPSLRAELLAEFLGTFVFILFGTGVVAMVVLFPTNNPGEMIHGGFTNITLGWGLAVTMGMYIAGRVSGAHLNPAVTLGLAVFRGFPWRNVMPYSLAQTAGAFAAAAWFLATTSPPSTRRSRLGADRRHLHHLSGVHRDTAGRFARSVAVPPCFSCLSSPLRDEFNMPPGANLAPLMIGLVVVAIGMSFGGMHGYPINPARDFGPRLFTVVAGFRNNGITDGGHVWWVPVVGPSWRIAGSCHLPFWDSSISAIKLDSEAGVVRR